MKNEIPPMKWIVLLASAVAFLAGMTSLQASEAEKSEALETATFGAGCFWCTEAVMQRVEGVKEVASGYMGGKAETANYKAVCTGKTDHAEVTQVKFDPEKVSFAELLEIFWQMHDPTTLNRQGADVGPQYRSAVFFHSDEQKEVAEESKKKAVAKFDDPIVTEITPADKFYIAEDYHQNYYNENKSQGYCRFVIHPKLKKLGMED